jgi:hypothetical protein
MTDSNYLERIILSSDTVNNNLSLLDFISSDDGRFLLRKYSEINSKIEEIHSDQLEQARRERDGSMLTNLGKTSREECSICMESIPNLTMLKHKVGDGYHFIHAKCLAQWRHGSGADRSNSKNCPVCRKKINDKLSDGSKIIDYLNENPNRRIRSSSSSDSDDELLIVGARRSRMINRAAIKKTKRKKKKKSKGKK